MKTRRIYCLLLLISLLCQLFSGCTAILERSYVTETPHISTVDEEDELSGIIELSTFAELKQALLSLIEEHVLMETLRLTEYSGNVEQDVRRVVRDVMKTPIGAYAVTNISYQSAQILTYHEIRFDISYRRTLQEIEAVREIEKPADLEVHLEEMMRQFSPVIVFQLPDYEEDAYHFDKMFQEIYYKHPELAYGFESLEVQLYPESGTDRIVELSVKYGQSTDTLTAKSETAAEEAQLILDSYTGSHLTANRIQYFYDTLVSSVKYDQETALLLSGSDEALPKSDPFTAYGALIKKEAVSEGFALAFRELCKLANIDCIVVSGKRDGQVHYWNLVLNHRTWSHIDCAAAVMEDAEPYACFGLTDEEMSSRYLWDHAAYPAADSHDLRDMLTMEAASGFDPAAVSAAEES